MSAQLVDHIFPSGHNCLNLVSIAAVARLLWMVGKIPAAWCTDPCATFVWYHWHIEAVVLRRVAEDVYGRLPTGLHQVHLLQEHLAEEDNAPVALAELFEVPLGDVALRHPAHVVLVKSNVEVGELALFICQRHDARWHHLLRWCGLARGSPPGVERDVERVRIVRRHAKLQRAANPEDVGKENGMPEPPLRMAFVLPLNDAALDDAVLECVEANHRVLAMAALKVRLLADENLLEIPAGVPVQVLHVGGIQGVLLALQPATGQVRDGNVPDRVVPHQRTPARQQRRRRRAHVDEDEPAEFLGLVGADTALVAEVVLRVRGVLEWLLDAAAAGVKLPAVVLAADTVVLDHAVGEAGAAVRAVLIDDAEMATAVAVDHEFLAQDFDLFRAEGAPE